MNKKVLMLDNDLSICRRMERLLSKRGVALVYANNLYEGTFQLSKMEPDIAIADFEFQFGRNITFILNDLKGKAKEVIILTNENPEELIERYPDLSFAKIIKKGTTGIKRAAELALL